MEILQLRYFYESAKNQSFAKTAAKYMVPATSVSASVKRLEKELGCEVFIRSHNKIVLNDNGKKLLQSLTKIFNELDQVVDVLTSVSSDTRKIKLLVRAMRGEITKRIIEYKTIHPNISFMTVFDFEEQDFEKYDLIIDVKDEKYNQYEMMELFKTKILLRASSKSQLCGKKITLKQLKEQAFISIGEKNSMNKILVEACQKAGFTPNIVVQSNDLLCNMRCVEAGVGIGLCRVYPGSKKPEGISYLNVTDFSEEQIICCYYKKETAYGNVEHFLKYLKTKL